MPGIPAPPEPDAIPVWIQWATAGGIMLGAAYASFRRFLAGKSAPAEPAKHVVLQQASIADMEPLRAIVAEVKALCLSAQRIEALIAGEIAERDTEEQDARRDAETRRIFAEELQKTLGTVSPRGRSRRRKPAARKPA